MLQLGMRKRGSVVWTEEIWRLSLTANRQLQNSVSETLNSARGDLRLGQKNPKRRVCENVRARPHERSQVALSHVHRIRAKPHHSGNETSAR